MKKRERIMAVLHHEKPDIIPVTAYAFLLPRGDIERQLRNIGLGLVELGVPVYGIRTPNVTMESSERPASLSVDERYICLPNQKHMVNRSYTTPLGQVSERCKLGYAAFEWPLEWVIRDLQGYEKVKYIIDDTEYFPAYEEFQRAEDILGEDGLVVSVTSRSPIQTMLLDLMGYRRFAMDFYLHIREFEDLYFVLRKKQLEMYRVVADSPAEVVLMDENLNGLVTSPKLFERYCVPFYDEVAQILHAKGKILMAHMDGRLRCLKDLIGRTEIDVVEAFTPPPIGDLPIEEARASWQGKVLWTTFPATLAVGSGEDRVKAETLAILRGAAPGDDFAVGITEDIGDIKSSIYGHVLMTITQTTMKHGVYPIEGRSVTS